MATKVDLNNLDVTFVIDKSGSMDDKDVVVDGERQDLSRWEFVRETVGGLASQLAKYDKDGFSLYIFDVSFFDYDGVTPDQVKNVWSKFEPGNGTKLGPVLEAAINKALDNRSGGEGKQQLIVVITDGAPTDRSNVAKVIIQGTNRMNKDEDMAILFLQVGQDAGAKAFLTQLDDDLQRQGAKFDAVDVKTIEEVWNLPIEQLVEIAFND